MNGGLNGIPSHFSKPANLIGQLLDITGPIDTGNAVIPLSQINTSWNNSAATFTALNISATIGPSSNNANRFLNFARNGTQQFAVNEFGVVNTASNALFGGIAVAAISIGTAPPFSAVTVQATNTMGFAPANNVAVQPDCVWSRGGAATFQFGIADAAAPVAQTLQVQSVVAGTSNIAGVNWTIKGSKGTGTGAGGQIILQTAPAGTTGTAQNALATGLTITAPAVGQQPSVLVGNQALATNATDGFLYIPSGAGAPTGTPTAFTGLAPLYWDSTDKKLFIFSGGSWLGGTAPGVWS